MSDVRRVLETTIQEICDIEPSLLADDKTFAKDLGIDSVDFLDVIYELDKHFEIKLPVEEWIDLINNNKAKVEDFFTVGKLVQHIASQVALKKAG